MASIELQESVVARLAELAKSEGLSIEGYLAKVAELPTAIGRKLPPLTGEELDKLLDAEASDATTYQGTYSRADIYFDHD